MQGIRPYTAFEFRILVKSEYKFHLWDPIPLLMHRWGEFSSVPNSTPIGATCRPCGPKNLKIGLWVT